MLPQQCINLLHFPHPTHTFIAFSFSVCQNQQTKENIFLVASIVATPKAILISCAFSATSSPTSEEQDKTSKIHFLKFFVTVPVVVTTPGEKEIFPFLAHSPHRCIFPSAASVDGTLPDKTVLDVVAWQTTMSVAKVTTPVPKGVDAVTERSGRALLSVPRQKGSTTTVKFTPRNMRARVWTTALWRSIFERETHDMTWSLPHFLGTCTFLGERPGGDASVM